MFRRLSVLTVFLVFEACKTSFTASIARFGAVDALHEEMQMALNGYTGDQELAAKLTPREREVMVLLLEGRANKVIAYDLGISTRTVEVHRARVMAKVGVRNAVELASRVHHRHIDWLVRQASLAPYGGATEAAPTLHEPSRPGGSSE